MFGGASSGNAWRIEHGFQRARGDSIEITTSMRERTDPY
jgi:hypothetical protein